VRCSTRSIVALAAALSAAGAGRAQEETPAPVRPYQPGFRVQVAATPSPLSGQRALRRARRLSELPAAIEWEGGLYKVRVGAFLDRSLAELGRGALLDSIPDAWVVPSVVRPAEVEASSAVLGPALVEETQ